MQIIKARALLYALLVAFLLLLGFVYKLYIDYDKQNNEAKMRAFFDYQIKQLNKSVEDAKLGSMAISVLLGRNDSVQQCFLDSNRDKCVQNINELIATLGAVAMYKNIKIHLHDTNLKSYVRSWDAALYGDILSSFRYLISEAIEHKRPVAGVEAGVAGVHIRAVSGVMSGVQNIGSVEVLLNYEHIGNFFKEQGVDLFVLLDKNIGAYHTPTPNDELLSEHYIENLTNANLNVLDFLRELNLHTNDFYVHGTHFFSISPLIDASSKRIGHYILHVNTDETERALSQNYTTF